MSDYIERRINEKCDNIARDLTRVSEMQIANNRKMTEMFNRMATAIEGLTNEVRALREDLNPKALDKPKLPSPEQGA
jgi:hypothetical protein